MTASGVRPQRHLRPSRMFAYFSLAIMIGGWLAFAAALVASQGTLDDVWSAVRDLPLPLELCVWVIGFPFLLGLAIWQAALPEGLRLTAIAVLALVYVFMFLPRERVRT
jgi:hypothetical protein